MPASARPRNNVPRAPFPLVTPYQSPSSFELHSTHSSPQASAPGVPAKPSEESTPVSIPQPTFAPVNIVPAAQIPATTTKQDPIPKYAGSAVALLTSYCTEPAYTLLDGPTALWVPVVGCISSKADCCPTPTAGANPAVTSNNGAGNVGGAAFVIGQIPVQGTLTGCPSDYHTVGKTACCPSKYWLWTAEMGGQIPCYSQLQATMTPPPIPDTLIQERGPQTGSASLTSGTFTRKPVSAIVNVAFAMQYPMVTPKAGMKKETKIGVGVGVAAGVIFLGLLAWFLFRILRARHKSRNPENNTSVHQRFGTGVDMSRVADETKPAPMSRTYGGAKYAGVSTRNGDY
ncbi:hypothetical protein B0J11DRAFT_563738 [Dendryphion nanum]|uniref:Uncharacterized protein n=1 Tax=Dendryphion nanum TaxID=256645 RepID=A0A9P9EKN0_9PLEO|nr:hypothetical protein B0J11DRAFT_563738 [Dendryphion nanum]